MSVHQQFQMTGQPVLIMMQSGRHLELVSRLNRPSLLHQTFTPPVQLGLPELWCLIYLIIRYELN